jgi:hypothetical protein
MTSYDEAGWDNRVSWSYMCVTAVFAVVVTIDGGGRVQVEQTLHLGANQLGCGLVVSFGGSSFEVDVSVTTSGNEAVVQ